VHTIRPLTPADADLYTALRREMITREPWAFLGVPGDDRAGDADHIRQSLADPENVILGAFTSDNPPALVAVVGLYREKRFKCRHRAAIWGVYTTPDARARGLSRQLMTAAIDHARTWSGVEVICLSAAETSTVAIAIYESLGFRQWGTQPDATRVDKRSVSEVYLQLTLTPHPQP